MIIERIWNFNGFDCVAALNEQMGVRVGYVRIPEDHQWYGLDYDDIPCEAHGGLTFSNFHPGIEWAVEIPDGYWIGFDCGHAWDQWPVEEAAAYLPKELFDRLSELRNPNGRLWETEDVVQECEWIALQATYVGRKRSLLDRVLGKLRPSGTRDTVMPHEHSRKTEASRD